MTDTTLTDPPSPSSVADLTLTRERDRCDVNRFLDRNHPRGSVPGWKACFGGRYQDHLVVCVVLGRPVSRYNDDGKTIAITRLGLREDRPANSGSWIIARARKWAALEGYETLLTFAGVSGNYGTVYEASGFECAEVVQSDGDNWTRRQDRDSWADYERRKWRYDLQGAEVRG